ncbi:YitT family protein [Viridibacillus sp. FSL E2-0187]|uniref:YitT family protein n=1 Tax=Viridibacillus TaxID=496496 RepID=UPI00187B2C34|nr:YitT family protein [Viridibacillus sp. JNUCC-6]QOV10280.1 YitT family protein [Viridibacillus sp. JNUCC-6]
MDSDKKAKIVQRKKSKIKKNVIKLFFLTIGALIMAVGLEMVLIPNNLIDGGVTGIAIMASHLTNLSLGLFLFLFNLPFLYLGYKQIGRTFAFSVAYGIVVLSIATSFMHNSSAFTNDTLLATVLGGILLGIGVGIAIRAGGCLDGSETLAILFNKKLPFSVGQIILFMNLFILGSAGFVFGFDRAMYSLISYFIAFKTIDLVSEGLNQTKSIWIISDEADEIGDQIMSRLGRGITYLNGQGGYSKDDKQVIFCVISRLEESKLKNIVEDVDPSAFLAFSNMTEIQGGNFKKKDVH